MQIVPWLLTAAQGAIRCDIHFNVALPSLIPPRNTYKKHAACHSIVMLYPPHLQAYGFVRRATDATTLVPVFFGAGHPQIADALFASTFRAVSSR